MSLIISLTESTNALLLCVKLKTLTLLFIFGTLLECGLESTSLHVYLNAAKLTEESFFSTELHLTQTCDTSALENLILPHL